MSELTSHEREVLVRALGNESGEVTGLSHPTMIRLSAQGFVIYHQPSRKGCLSTAGVTVATLLKDTSPPSDLTRAQELLREWREAADNAEEHRALPAAQLCWEDGHGWYASLEWPVNDARLGWHTVSGPGPSDPNPLAAVRAAIAQTPWADVENK